MKKEKYNHIEVEKKWQKYWKDHQVFKAKIDPSKPKYYILDMWPYPSGAGLHVGHVTGYTATDILARYKRQKGFNVLHPMGWDSFGLQAEQYAIRTGTHPKITTEKKHQHLPKAIAISWILAMTGIEKLHRATPSITNGRNGFFSKLYEKGLAYEAEMLVNYCPELGTVLSNEEVEDGKSVEGGYLVERRPLRQWILKITAYAELLLKDLDLLDWPESLKTIQRNWIGKSVGAKVVFLENETKQPITVYTTRHDTLFGSTFLVVSPEHPIIDEIVTSDCKKEVDCYIEESRKKSDFERTELNKEKTGVWTGAYAINPVNHALIPIWVGDYVLMNYGTGAVVGVPSADERDFEFVKKYDLPVIATCDPEVKEAPEGLTEEDVRLEVLAGKRCWIKEGKAINGKSDLLDINGLNICEAKEKVANFLETNKVGERWYHL